MQLPVRKPPGPAPVRSNACGQHACRSRARKAKPPTFAASPRRGSADRSLPFGPRAVAGHTKRWYTIHMKRTNLVVDTQLLETAKRELGLKTYSETVNECLREVLRRRTFEKIDSYAGSDIWEGSLSEMREDRGVSR